MRVEQIPEMTHAGIDVLCRIAGIGDPVAGGRRRHELHGAECALRRDGPGVIPGLHPDHRRHEFRCDLVEACVVVDQRRQLQFSGGLVHPRELP